MRSFVGLIRTVSACLYPAILHILLESFGTESHNQSWAPRMEKLSDKINNQNKKADTRQLGTQQQTPTVTPNNIHNSQHSTTDDLKNNTEQSSADTTDKQKQKLQYSHWYYMWKICILPLLLTPSILQLGDLTTSQSYSSRHWHFNSS